MEPQVWSKGRSFPGGISIKDKGPAAETAKLWRNRDTVWTGGSQLDNGEVGAACVWKAEEGWKGQRFHLGNNKEVFDAEVFAIYRALKIFEGLSGTGHCFTVSQTPKR